MPGVTANANPPTQGSKYRIKVGQTIGALVWSNIATTVKGFWTIIYDDGSPDYWPMVETPSGSSRATVLVPTSQVAKKNGWVVDGYVGVNTPTVPQRGQVYVQAIIVDPNLSVTSSVIACGYAYAGHLVNIGTFVEPGPAGGHGAITTVATDNPAAGVQHAALTMPAGTVRRLRSYEEAVAAFTAAAKSISFITTGSQTGRAGRSVTFTPAAAAGRIDAYGAGISYLDTAVNGIVVPLDPWVLLFAADTLTVVLNGIAGGDDLAAGDMTFEEWVVPN